MHVFKSLCITAILLVSGTFILAASPAVAGTTEQKAILVTGASTGIGRNLTETLAAKGHFVFAGARKQKDLDALNAIENVQAIRLDVTVQEEIDAAVATVKESGRGLWGLVNNAGIYVGGPMIELELDEVEWLFDVNVYGVYRVTQAFAPLIIESKGRISNVGSIAGILTGQMSGPYSMSKHAIEAYTDGLAAELAAFGVHVSVIEPGNYKSDIALTAGERMMEKGQLERESLYKDALETFKTRMNDRSQYKEPDEVSAAAMHALFDENPKRRYMVVPNAEEAGWTIGQAMRELIQLNEGQPYTYSRDELIKLLDATMTAE